MNDCSRRYSQIATILERYDVIYSTTQDHQQQQQHHRNQHQHHNRRHLKSSLSLSSAFSSSIISSTVVPTIKKSSSTSDHSILQFLTSEFSFLNMLQIDTTLSCSHLLKLLRCLYEIISIEVLAPPPTHSFILEFLLKSSFLTKLQDIYIYHHNRPEIITLIGELLALFAQNQLYFPLSPKSSSPPCLLLKLISNDIYFQKFTLSNLENYCLALNTFCLHKLQNKSLILEGYVTCLSKLKKHPKSYQLACELFGLILVTDWSSPNSFFQSKSPLPSPLPSREASVSSLKLFKSFKSYFQPNKPTQPQMDPFSFISLILDQTLLCFDYHLKTIPSHLSSRTYFIQLACHAFRALFSSPLDTNRDLSSSPSSSLSSMIFSYHEIIQSKITTLSQETAAYDQENLCKDENKVWRMKSLNDCLSCLQANTPSSGDCTDSIVTVSSDEEEGEGGEGGD